MPEKDADLSEESKKIKKRVAKLDRISSIFSFLTLVVGAVCVITFLVSFFGGIFLNWKGGVSPIWWTLCWSSFCVGVVTFIIGLSAGDKRNNAIDLLKSQTDGDRKKFKNDLSKILGDIENSIKHGTTDIFEKVDSEYRDVWENAVKEIGLKKENIKEMYNMDIGKINDFISKNIPDKIINDDMTLNDCIDALESGMAINYREAMVYANNQKNERERKDVLDRMDARARRAHLEQQEMQEQLLRYQEQQLRYQEQQTEYAGIQAESAKRQEQYAKEQKETAEKAQQDIERIRRGDFNPY